MTSIAQVGCGHWGKNLARNFYEAGVLSAIVDGDESVARMIGQQLSVPVRDLDDVLSDPAIDGVALATPAETHAALGRRVLEAGKHLFVEKPIALTIAEAEELIACAQAAGRHVMIGHLLQYHPVFRKLHDLVGQGLIGPLRYVYSNRLSLGKFRVEEDVMWSFAPHDLSMLIALAGLPVGVARSGASFVTEGIEDWTLLTMEFSDGVRGHVQVSWAHPFKEQRLVAVGRDGALVFDDSAPAWEEKLLHYAHGIDMDGPVPAKKGRPGPHQGRKGRAVAPGMRRVHRRHRGKPPRAH
jgi:UDP-2-acetamido-3-amino-2,3-dideoxy-glucuronate N-acetyltransferase